MMYTAIYKITDIPIRINSIHQAVHNLCMDYQTKEHPQFTITTTQSDIEFERKKSNLQDQKEGREIRQFSDSYLETLAVYRKIAEVLLQEDCLLFHGSAVAVDGSVYLFTAKSGTGKSTHTRLWRTLFGSRAVMVNDDKPLLKVMDKGVMVYGTPWDGKHRLSSNIAVPLKAICILERSQINHIKPISRKEALPVMIQQTYRPSDTEKLAKTMKLVDRLMSGAAIYRLGCNMELEAARIAYEGMQEERIGNK